MEFASSPNDDAARLQTRQLSLRVLRDEDAVTMARYLSEWDVVKQTTSVPFPYDAHAAQSWIARVRSRQGDGVQYVFALTLRGEDQLLGTVSLGLTGTADKPVGEIGYWLGKPHWGFGFASEAVHAMTDFGFRSLGINRIEAAVFKDNSASARVLEKSGYTLDRTETRQYSDRGGKRKVLCYVAQKIETKVD